MEGMDEGVNERQIQSKRGEGDDEGILKKQRLVVIIRMWWTWI